MRQTVLVLALLVCLSLLACAPVVRTPEQEDVGSGSVPSTAMLDALLVPATPQAGSEATLHMLSTAPLVPSHHRELHIIVVGNGFDAFAHLHPEDFDEGVVQKTQHYQVPVTFPTGGEYLVAIDGMTHNATVATQQRVTVAGDAHENSTTNITCVRGTPLGPNDELHGFISLSDLETNCGDAYAIDLFRNPDGAIRFSARLNGEPFDPDQYLGAYAHLIIVRTDLSAAYHEYSDFGSGMFSVTPYLPPGHYVIFPQFKHNGTLVVTRFFIDVE